MLYSIELRMFACCVLPVPDTAARHLRVCVLRVDQVHRDCMICRRRHCVCRPNVLREIRRLLQPPYTLMLASWACRTLPPCAIIGSRIVCERRVVQSSGAQHSWHTQRLDATLLRCRVRSKAYVVWSPQAYALTCIYCHCSNGLSSHRTLRSLRLVPPPPSLPPSHSLYSPFPLLYS